MGGGDAQGGMHREGGMHRVGGDARASCESPLGTPLSLPYIFYINQRLKENSIERDRSLTPFLNPTCYCW